MKLKTPGLYYEKKGSGDFVVLLHGFTLDTRMWDDQFDLLAKSYQVIRFDHRGHGRSEGVREQFMQDEDLKALLQPLGVDRVHIVGLSMGGLVATIFAIKNPEMLRSLVLVDSAVTFDPSREFDHRLLNHISNGMNRGLEAGLKEWLADPLFEPANKIPFVRNRLEKIVMEGHLTQAQDSFFLKAASAVTPSPPLDERLNEVAAPTLVIVGELDLPHFQENADTLSSGISGAKRITISGAGHMSNMENPEEFNEILTEFLSKYG